MKTRNTRNEKRFAKALEEYPFVACADIHKTYTFVRITSAEAFELLGMNIIPFPKWEVRVFMFKTQARMEKSIKLLALIDPNVEEIRA